jgi:hypothetical protein
VKEACLKPMRERIYDRAVIIRSRLEEVSRRQRTTSRRRTPMLRWAGGAAPGNRRCAVYIGELEARAAARTAPAQPRVERQVERRGRVRAVRHTTPHHTTPAVG